VTGGAVAGHGVATALAVAGGSALTRVISPSTLQVGGKVVGERPPPPLGSRCQLINTLHRVNIHMNHEC
jgi:hypothetical protein